MEIINISIPISFCVITVWNGRDNIGEFVGAGVYFIVFKAGDFQQSRKILLMK